MPQLRALDLRIDWRAKWRSIPWPILGGGGFVAGAALGVLIALLTIRGAEPPTPTIVDKSQVLTSPTLPDLRPLPPMVKAPPAPPPPVVAPPPPPPPELDLSPFTFQHASELLAQQRPADALKCLDKFVQAQGTAVNLRQWQFARSSEVAAIGRSRMYLTKLFGRYVKAPPTDRPLISLGDQRRGRDETCIVCIDLATGRQLWERHVVGPIARFRLLVDPVTDDLYINAQKQAMRFTADTGAEALLQVDNDFAAVLNGGRSSPGRYGYILIYDVQQEKIRGMVEQDVDMAQSANLVRCADEAAFDELLKRMTHPLAGQTRHWAFLGQGDWLASEPGDHVGSVFVLLGGYDRSSQVLCLQGPQGDVKWRYEFASGAGENFDRMANGPPPIDLFAKTIVTMDHAGMVILLDARTGSELAQLGPYTKLLCLPRVVGDTLVVATSASAEALSIPPRSQTARRCRRPPQDRDPAGALPLGHGPA